MNEQEMDKLITKMQGVFVTKNDLVIFATKDDAKTIQNDVKSIQHDVKTIQNDVKTVQNDISMIRQDHANLEEKVDTLTEIVNSIKEDVSSIKNHLYDMPTKDEFATLEKEHNQMKTIFKEKLNMEVAA